MLPQDAKPLHNLHASPSEVAMCWPDDSPMVALIGNSGHSKWSRWSIVGHASGKKLTVPLGQPLGTIKDELSTRGTTTLLPNWIGYVSYELGYTIEPKCGEAPASDWPNAEFVWCECALIHDAESDSWWSIGNCKVPEMYPSEEHTRAWGDVEDSTSSESFSNAVKQTIKYIHAGDIFQANITRRYSATVDGNLRMQALAMLQKPGGWYGAWLEFPEEGRYVMSMSPELFMQYNEESRAIVTRPMKGTRPEGDAPEALLESSKDAAELHMIVDLMRNDLGRLCEFGSVQVQEARAIERHPTVWQCVGEVHGKVRKGLSVIDVLNATFPPGSVTGAPKIRAMQIINELEDTPRGPYCGAIGILGKIAMLNVAIRTALFQGKGTPSAFCGTMEYSSGCGIVAESDPQAETEESEVKTRILRRQR